MTREYKVNENCLVRVIPQFQVMSYLETLERGGHFYKCKFPLQKRNLYSALRQKRGGQRTLLGFAVF